MSRLRDFLVKSRAEILTSSATVVGWVAITSAVAELVPPAIVWRVSAGIFLLSLVGWKLLFTIATRGLYNLTRSKRG